MLPLNVMPMQVVMFAFVAIAYIYWTTEYLKVPAKADVVHLKQFNEHLPVIPSLICMSISKAELQPTLW